MVEYIPRQGICPSGSPDSALRSFDDGYTFVVDRILGDGDYVVAESSGHVTTKTGIAYNNRDIAT
jgi:hypothetical protein